MKQVTAAVIDRTELENRLNVLEGQFEEARRAIGVAELDGASSSAASEHAAEIAAQVEATRAALAELGRRTEAAQVAAAETVQRRRLRETYTRAIEYFTALERALRLAAEADEALRRVVHLRATTRTRGLARVEGLDGDVAAALEADFDRAATNRTPVFGTRYGLTAEYFAEARQQAEEELAALTTDDTATGGRV
jgi:hypothetical protein